MRGGSRGVEGDFGDSGTDKMVSEVRSVVEEEVQNSWDELISLMVES